MGELKLYGMKAAFDEIMATAVVNGHRSLPECGLSKFPDPAGLTSSGDQPAL
jgi:hypothetical protein